MAIQKTKTEKPHTDRPTGTTVWRKLQGLETGELPRVDFLRLARGCNGFYFAFEDKLKKVHGNWSQVCCSFSTYGCDLIISS